MIEGSSPPDWLRIPLFSLSEIEILDLRVDHSLDMFEAVTALSQQKSLKKLNLHGKLCSHYPVFA